MPETYRIHLTLKAAADLQSVFEFVEEDSPQNAVKLIRRLFDAIDSLEILPACHQVVKGAESCGEEIRSMCVRPYLVRYYVDESNRIVTVLSVRHGARCRGS